MRAPFISLTDTRNHSGRGGGGRSRKREETGVGVGMAVGMDLAIEQLKFFVLGMRFDIYQ